VSESVDRRLDRLEQALGEARLRHELAAYAAVNGLDADEVWANAVAREDRYLKRFGRDYDAWWREAAAEAGVTVEQLRACGRDDDERYYQATGRVWGQW
jgi:hypothetical protein